jgi:hypothetical protein
VQVVEWSGEQVRECNLRIRGRVGLVPVRFVFISTVSTRGLLIRVTKLESTLLSACLNFPPLDRKVEVEVEVEVLWQQASPHPAIKDQNAHHCVAVLNAPEL